MGAAAILFISGHCQFRFCAVSRAETLPSSADVLDLTSGFQECVWASAFRLTPMWNQDGKITVLASVNVSRADRDYEVLCELNSWNLLEHPFQDAVSSRFREGFGVAVGQFRSRGAEPRGSQGALLLDRAQSDEQKGGGALEIAGLDTWEPGGVITERTMRIPVASHRLILDSFGIESGKEGSFCAAVIGLGGEEESVGVHFISESGQCFAPFVSEAGNTYRCPESGTFPYRASFALGMSESNAPYVVGFFASLDTVFTFRFDPEVKHEKIPLLLQEDVSSRGAHIVASAANQGSLAGADRFYLVHDFAEAVFLSSDSEGDSSPDWKQFVFTPNETNHLAPVLLKIDCKEYQPKGNHGRVATLGFTTCQSGTLGIAATVNSLGLSRRLVTLGMGGGEGSNIAVLRRVRIDPFSRGIFDGTYSLLLKVSGREYMLLAPTYIPLRESDLGLPPEGSMSIARFDEVNLKSSGGTFLRPLEVYSLQPQEYLKRKYMWMR